MHDEPRHGGAGRHHLRSSASLLLSPAAAEQLLDGGDGPTDLRKLLDAAAGPAVPGELRGERVAVAAFAEAGHHLRRRGPAALGAALTRAFAVKALAVLAVGVGATGGVVLAAHNTAEPARPPAASAPAAPGVPAAGPAGTGGVDPSGIAVQDPPAGPGLTEQCTAWAAGAVDNPGRAADNPAFAALAAAAGGEDGIPALCTDLTGSAAPGRPATAPGQPDAADARPDTAPGQSGTAPGPDGPGGQADPPTDPPAADAPDGPGKRDEAPGAEHRPTKQPDQDAEEDAPGEGGAAGG